MSAEHSPLPWVHYPKDNIIVSTGDGRIMDCQCRSVTVEEEVRDANAAFVVKACNAYPGLVSAIQAIRDFDTGTWLQMNFYGHQERGKMANLLDALYKHLSPK